MMQLAGLSNHLERTVPLNVRLFEIMTSRCASPNCFFLLFISIYFVITAELVSDKVSCFSVFVLKKMFTERVVLNLNTTTFEME